MLKLGLTGGIASGKSIVGQMFVRLGAHLIQSDEVSRSLLQPGQRAYDEVVRTFGPAILQPDHTINRARLAQFAFSPEPGQPTINDLNAIIHPAVITRENQWMDDLATRDPHAIAIVEAALILESNSASRFDRLIVVTCTEAQRVARFAARQKISEAAARAEVARRMAAQLPDSEKVAAADFVIDNSGSLASTEQQVAAVFAKLRA